MVGVSKDSVKSHQKFIEKQELNFTLISDEDGKICEDYGDWLMKKIIGREIIGIVRTTFLIGADGKILKVYPKVSVKGHVDEIHSDIKTMEKKCNWIKIKSKSRSGKILLRRFINYNFI